MAETLLPVEPGLPPSVGFEGVEAVRTIIRHHLRAGQLWLPALLFENMAENPRLRGAFETRANGLLATQVRFEPSRNNRDARQAASWMTEDWRFMAPAPQRQAQLEWGLALGVATGVRVSKDSPTSGRRLFRLRNYWPGWASWDDLSRSFRVDTQAMTAQDVPSPSYALTPPDPATNPWVIHEPFGEQSWRRGFSHALWSPYIGHEKAFFNLNRASDKLGLGITKVLHPEVLTDEDKKAVAVMAVKLKRMGREGTVPLPQGPRGPVGKANWDILPFEFQSNAGLAIINDALNTAAIAFAILLLGHNLTTEVKGGSYAAAGVGEFIRVDIKNRDGAAEAATLHQQLVQPWALENCGDPELAPIMVYVTDPPAVNESAARTLQLLGLAIRELKTFIPELDTSALAERYQLPLKVIDKNSVQVPAAPAQEQAA